MVGKSSPMRPYLLVSMLTLGVAAFVCDCGDDGQAGAQSVADAGDTSTCGLQSHCGRPEEVELAEGLKVDASDDHFTLRIDTYNTLAPTDNVWTVTLLDAAGDPMAGADLSVSVWSYDCMHGGPTPPEEITTDDAGAATIHPLAVHGGPWDVIVEVDAAGTTDTVVVPLCIPGATHNQASSSGAFDLGSDAGK